MESCCFLTLTTCSRSNSELWTKDVVTYKCEFDKYLQVFGISGRSEPQETISNAHAAMERAADKTKSEDTDAAETPSVEDEYKSSSVNAGG